MTCQMQLQWVAMQVTGCLPFTPMLSAGCLHGHLYVCSVLWYIKSGKPGKVYPGKVKQLWQLTRLAIHSLAIHLLTCSTKCSVYFSQILTRYFIIISVQCFDFLALFKCPNLLLPDAKYCYCLSLSRFVRIK